MIGGAYLAFEATEKILEVVMGDHHAAVELIETDTPQELEKRQVSGAIRTDFILSAEIMAIALNELGDMSIGLKSAALALVAHGHHGRGLWRCRDHREARRYRPAHGRAAAARRRAAFGRFLVKSVPGLLKSLSTIGTAAMLWVGGGILLHGIEDLGLHHRPARGPRPRRRHRPWLRPAGCRSWPGWPTPSPRRSSECIIGGIIVIIVRQFTKHPEQLIVD